MKNRFAITLLVIFTLSLLAPHSARADGIIIPQPPPCRDCPPPPCPGPFPCPPPSPMVQLAIRYHQVNVAIQDQVAITHVDQVFFNPNQWPVEGTYIFPLPADAAVTNFTLWIDGTPVEGRILNAEQARQEYLAIVNSMRDPALLEYAGRGAVQAHIFPIPPGGERRVELEYTQALAADNGLVRYIYPLGTEKFSTWPLERVSIAVDIRSNVPIRAVYSPSHNVTISRDNSSHVSAGYEANNVLPDTDFALYYSLGETEAFHLLSYRDPTDRQDPDGYFLALLAPRPEVAAVSLSKDLILVLDQSGSMEGEKFRQAQDALRYILQHLNPEDRFNIIVFSTGTYTFSNNLRPATDAKEALSWVDRLAAQGSTDINRALLEAAAMANPEKPTYLIFMTDGLPTEGVVDSQQILNNFAAAAPESLRLFPFGVGYDVDTFLLDSLAQNHHGASTYVLPGDRLDEALSSFYSRISTPVLTDLSLDFGSIVTYDLYPFPLPDLFSGSQILVVGRYRDGGVASVTLTGRVNEAVQTFTFPEQVLTQDGRGSDPTLAALPRLWATRKIGHLLNQIRLQGPNQETIDQIVRLSIRFGIVTPYTSYLVTETMPLGAAEQRRIADEQLDLLQAAPAPPASGANAVQKAADQGSLASAESPAAPSSESAGRVRVAGSRTFVFSEGKWIDTTFDPQTMPTVQVLFLSDDYFALADSRPELAAAFALGKALIVVIDGTAYEVIAEGTPAEPVILPPTLSSIQPANPTLPALNPPSLVTPAFVQPVATQQPLVSTEVPQAAPFPCLGGLLPLLLPLLVWLILRRQRA